MHPDDLEKTKASAHAVNKGEQLVQFENRYIHKNGDVIHILWSARWSESDQRRIGVARDISEQKRLEQEREDLINRLSEMALTDPLTHLPKRSLFYDRVRTAQTRAQRDGHGLAIRATDTAAGLGGDEFVVLVDALARDQGYLDTVIAIAEKIRQAMYRAKKAGGNRVSS